MARGTILVVDDEKNILTTLARALRLEDYDVDVAGNAAIALEKLQRLTYDVVLLDVKLPDIDGLTVTRTLRERGNDVPVILMSGHGSIETAVDGIHAGARQFFAKPVNTDQLLAEIASCIREDKLKHENLELKQQAGAFEDLLGESAPMRHLKEQVALAANANAPVLVTGERGTGKELVARAIHLGSRRKELPYEKLNCAAVPSELIESELFGHEAGAFTGATKQRRGKFERASGGTLFLDEVGDMPSSMQAKLLRVLQEGEIERVGGSDLLRVDVRVVAATNKDLRRAIDDGEFRADLFDRLNVVPLRVPALRERREDIRGLAGRFLQVACEANGRRHKTLTEGAIGTLGSYDYPGNVRELKNLIERIVILTTADEVRESDVKAFLPIGGGASGGGYYEPGKPLREMLEGAERDLVLRSLEHNQGHITNTAADLGLERSHLYKKMKALGIRREGEQA